jgi:hypothetical protein
MDVVLFLCAIVGMLASGLYIADYIDTKRRAPHKERPNRARRRG